MYCYLYRLIPPRPTFPGDMTDAESKIMEEHIAYWGQQIEKRKVIVYGPVLDPQGTYGIAVVETGDEGAARTIILNDPAIRSHAGFRFDLHPMPDTIVRQ